MKAVEVVWYDTYSIDAWMSQNDLAIHVAADNRGQLARTRGWLYSEDEFKVVLAMTWAPEVKTADEEHAFGIVVIPRGVIVEILYEGE